jgi:hypothetical protein
MNKLFFTVLVFILPAGAGAGSTDTVRAPGQYQQPQGGAIILYGHTGVMKSSRDTNGAGLRQGATAEYRTGAGLEFRKKKIRRSEVKKAAETPVKKKLVPVHFKEEPSHKTPYTCKWALGKFFEIIGGPKPAPTPEPLKPPDIQTNSKLK